MMAIRRILLVAGAALTLAVVTAPEALVAQQVFESSQVTDVPRIASPMAAQRSIERAYSSGLQSRGIQGKVMLQFVVQENGKVDPSSVVVKTADHADLGAAAQEAIASIEFVPGRVQGAAVATRVIFPITFVAR